jgi:hypothetical protein
LTTLGDECEEGTYFAGIGERGLDGVDEEEVCWVDDDDEEGEGWVGDGWDDENDDDGDVFGDDDDKELNSRSGANRLFNFSWRAIASSSGEWWVTSTTMIQPWIWEPMW